MNISKNLSWFFTICDAVFDFQDSSEPECIALLRNMEQLAPPLDCNKLSKCFESCLIMSEMQPNTSCDPKSIPQPSYVRESHVQSPVDWGSLCSLWRRVFARRQHCLGNSNMESQNNRFWYLVSFLKWRDEWKQMCYDEVSYMVTYLVTWYLQGMSIPESCKVLQGIVPESTPYRIRMDHFRSNRKCWDV